MRVLATTAIALTVVVSLGGLALWASLSPKAPAAYYVCVDQVGSVRLLDAELQGNFATACKKNETLVKIPSEQRVVDVEAAVSALEGAIGDVSALEAALGDVHATLAGTQADIGVLQTDTTQAQSSISGLQTDLTKVEGDIAELDSLAGSLETRLAALEAGAPPPATAPVDVEQQVLDILGPSGVVLPLVDPNEPSSFTTLGSAESVFTWSEAPSAWDTPFDPTSPDSWQGIAPVLTFNGSDEDATAPDAAYWSRASGAFSMGVWVNMNDATSSFLLSRNIATGNFREWDWSLGSSDQQTMQLVDESESGNPTLNTIADAATAEGVWVHLVVTIDGTADASGLNLYENGVLVASSDLDEAAFVALEDLGQVTRLGSAQAGTNYFDGKMAGGPLGPFFTQKELTADDVSTLYEMGRVALGL